MEIVTKTSELALKYPAQKYKILGKTGYSVSVCGFGSYRIDDGIKSHEKALRKSIQSGINIIDTSSNYSDGGSEKLIGTVLNELTQDGNILRDEIVIVSKGGYIQGSNFELASERGRNAKPFPEITKCSPDLWHCIHPEFLENQITLSLARLNLKKIDVYLLHNPEYYLTYSQISDQERREKEYYRRIEKAFIHLEKEVENGRINYYGISSNTFALPSDRSDFTSLEKIIEIASSISDKNHFAVVQFPMNLFEQGGAINKNQNNGKTTFLKFAEDANLGVLVNRPLNAIVKNQIIRLADYPVTENRSENEISELIEDLGKQEKTLVDKYVTFINLSKDEQNKLADYLSLAQILKSNRESFTSPGNFREIKTHHLVPRANYVINQIGKFFDDDYSKRYLRNYAVTTNILLDSIYSNLAKKQNERNRHVHQKLEEYLGANQKNLSLSQKSVLMINSLPAVTSTLVGMRNELYVDDVIGSIQADYIGDAAKFWERDFINN